MTLALRISVAGGEVRGGNANLKCDIDSRTASSNSIGPGISSVGCSAWLAILTPCSPSFDFGNSRCRGAYGISSASLACLSVENGVLIGIEGR